MASIAELKAYSKKLQTGESSKETLDILKLLKDNVKATESVIRESKIGIAVGKLRSNQSKEVADFAKDLVKRWKTEVERQKHSGGPSGNAPPKLTPAKKTNVADTVGSPTTPTLTAAARSAKADGVNINVTGDKTRDKCIELIYDSLCLGSAQPTDMILKKASAIESTVLSDHKGDMGKDYKAKIRSLFLNLKDKANPGLRTNVVNGKLPVERFCRMTAAEMASDERKAENKIIDEQNLHNSLGAAEQQAETDAFQCGKCKQRKTRYRQAQTRSADEPMTTFVTCVNCNHRWKFS